MFGNQMSSSGFNIASLEVEPRSEGSMLAGLETKLENLKAITREMEQYETLQIANIALPGDNSSSQKEKSEKLNVMDTVLPLEEQSLVKAKQRSFGGTDHILVKTQQRCRNCERQLDVT